MPNFSERLIPGSISLNRDGNNVVIRIRWFSVGYLFPVIALILLSVTFVPKYIEKVIHANVWIILVLLTPWVVFVLYYLLTKLVNSSYIYFNKKTVIIKYAPLPIKKGLMVSTDKLSDLKVVKAHYQRRSRRRYYKITYCDNGENKTLISDLDQYEQASFIVSELSLARGEVVR